MARLISMCLCLSVAVMCTVISVTNAEVVWGGDLLNDAGAFDTQDAQDAWTLYTKEDSGSRVEVVDWAGLSPPNGLILFGSGSSGANYGDWAQAEITFATVANRAHRVVLDGKMPTTRGSRLYSWLNSEEMRVTVSTSTFSTTSWTSQTFDYEAQAGSGATNWLLELQNRTINAETGSVGLYIDNVRVYREVATPQVMAQSVEQVNPGDTIDLMLTNTFGTLNDMLIAFDPDAVVEWTGGAQATVNSVTWNSDNEIIANITLGVSGGQSHFRVVNPYGGESSEFTLVPEPATITLALMGLAGLIVRRR